MNSANSLFDDYKSILPDQHQHHRHRRKFVSLFSRSFFLINKLRKHFFVVSPNSSSSISNFHAKRFLLINPFDNGADQNYVKVSSRTNAFNWPNLCINRKNGIKRLNGQFHYSNCSSLLLHLISIILLIFSSSTKAFVSANYGKSFRLFYLCFDFCFNSAPSKGFKR